jgi:hypothetical protein
VNSTTSVVFSLPFHGVEILKKSECRYAFKSQEEHKYLNSSATAYFGTGSAAIVDV